MRLLMASHREYGILAHLRWPRWSTDVVARRRAFDFPSIFGYVCRRVSLDKDSPHEAWVSCHVSIWDWRVPWLWNCLGCVMRLYHTCRGWRVHDWIYGLSMLWIGHTLRMSLAQLRVMIVVPAVRCANAQIAWTCSGAHHLPRWRLIRHS